MSAPLVEIGFLYVYNMKIKLSDIRIDGGTQPRSEIDYDIVAEYSTAMTDGASFPPVVVFNDGANYWLADGFHRYHASKKIDYLEIDAEVKSGTKRDAILYSVSANDKHGLRRSNADKRKAVLTLLEDEEWREWSDREIARQCAVDHKTVSRYRNETGGEIPQVRKGRDGKTYNTSNIGNRSEKPNSSALDDTKDLEPEDDGYDIAPPAARKGVGLEKAHEAISKLKQIPPNDDLLQEAYDTVIEWINFNR